MPALFDRYQSGDRQGVWDELHSLGARVRDPEVYGDAMAVAQETVRRARANFETIIQRLDAMGYRFEDEEALAEKRDQRLDRRSDGGLRKSRKSRAGAHSGARVSKTDGIFRHRQAAARDFARAKGESARAAARDQSSGRRLIYRRASKDAARNIADAERQLGGPLPLLLAAWWEQIDSISLAGSHPALCPAAAPMGLRFGGTMFATPFTSAPLPSANPNAITPDPFVVHSLDVLEDIEFEGGEMLMPLGPDDITKAGESGDCYYVILPAAAADFAVQGTPGNLLFVDYLRRTFACGGFPGWHGRADKPVEIEALNAGLLPV